MLAKLRQMKQDEGFTLVELLVVIAILGVLAGIVVFSVSGLSDNSQTSACTTETSEINTAEQAYYAQNHTYSSDLVAAKLLQAAPSWHTYTVTGSGATATYTITPDGTTCTA